MCCTYMEEGKRGGGSRTGEFITWSGKGGMRECCGTESSVKGRWSKTRTSPVVVEAHALCLRFGRMLVEYYPRGL